MIRSPRLHSCTGVSLRSPNKGRLLLGSRPAPMAYSQRQRKLPSSHAHKTLHALRYNGRHLCTGGLYTPKFSRAADTNPMNWIGPRHLVGDEHWALPSAWLASFSANKHARPTVCRDAVPPLSHRQVASSAERRSATFETEDRLDRPTATMCHATSVPWLNMQKRGSTVTLGLTVKRLALKPSQEACTVAIEQSAANEHTKPLELCCRRDCRATPSDPCLRTSMHRRSSLRRRGPQFGFRACGLDPAQPAAACWVQGHMSGRRFGEPNRPLGWWGAVCKGRHTRGQASVPMLSRATLGGIGAIESQSKMLLPKEGSIFVKPSHFCRSHNKKNFRKITDPVRPRPAKIWKSISSLRHLLGIGLVRRHSFLHHSDTSSLHSSAEHEAHIFASRP